MEQQELRCSDKTSNQAARAAPDKYTDTSHDVIQKDLNKLQLYNRKGKRSRKQQASRCDDNTSHQTALAGPEIHRHRSGCH